MKKLMFAAAVAAFAGMSFAVESDVVGYHTIQIYPGNNMFTVNFENMDDADGYTLDQIFPGTTMGLTAGKSATSADWIMTWDAANDKYATKYFLFNRGEGYEDKNFTWRQSQSVPASAKVKSGMCFWFYHVAEAGTAPISFTVAGKVEYSQQGATIIIRPGKNMIGSPFACDWDPNSLGTEFWSSLNEAGKVVAGKSATSSDWIMAWDSVNNKYGTKYFLFNRGEGYEDKNFTWRQSQSIIAPAGFIKMAVGAWYNCSGTGFTKTMEYPYNF